MADLSRLKGVAERDRRMIEQAETLFGEPPATMGFVKTLFAGHMREPLVFPYPESSPDERARCDELLAKLDDYLESEHPAIQIDQEQEIPPWVIQRLFRLGVMGMTIPLEYGGGGMGITSYNRVLERIGRTCGSTAVLVSAHQSIGCRAVMLFGTEQQKQRWLPHLASDWVSAFCLSEPNVGCDAGGQETRCQLSGDGQHYILNGEKKWATSGAISQLFTVMAKQSLVDPKTGRPVERVTALVCTPDMPGIEIFQKNRSKCGIRGTWQARMRFTNVKVPRDHLLHQEGKGLSVALSCLDYGRCTLSAGMLGGAVRAFEQATKWAQTRYQFQRPLADFELVKAKIARMSALCYAMDAVLYLTTGMLDRCDEDIMLETAICKMFCSEMGWRVVNDAMQIMGGEGYMTENEIERIFRDSRINLIVEGANEVMQSFVFAYGGKYVAEQMLGVRQAVSWDHHESPVQNLGRMFRALPAAAPLGAELYLGMRPPAPVIRNIGPALAPQADRLRRRVREFAHQFKVASRHYGERIITRQLVHARLADSAMWLHAWAATLSKLDCELRHHDASGNGAAPWQLERDKASARHFFDIAEREITSCLGALFDHDDGSAIAAADAALACSAQAPNDRFYIPEASPVARGSGRRRRQEGIRQFPGDADASSVHVPPQPEQRPKPA